MKEGEYSRAHEYNISEELYYVSVGLMVSVKTHCLKFIFFALACSSLSKNDNNYYKE